MTKWERLEPWLRRGRWDSLRIIDSIMESSLSHSEKLAAIAIATHRSKEYPKPSPGIRRLARLTSQRDVTVLLAIGRLEKRGLIRIERGHRQAHVYDLSPLMRGLLTVPPTGTDTACRIETVTASKERAVTASQNEAVAAERPPAGLSDDRLPDCAGPPQSDRPKEPGRNHLKEPFSAAPVGAAVSAPPLILEAPAEPKPKAPKPKASKPKPERSTEAKAGFTRIRDAFFQAYEQKTGRKPTFAGAEGEAVWRLFDALKGNSELACTTVRNAILSEFGGSTSLRRIASDPNAFGELRARRTNARPVQQGYVDDSAARDESWLGLAEAK